MEIKKNIENLSVEIIDIKLDTSTIPSIKEARLVYINGKSKLVTDIGRYDSNYRSPYQIKLNDVPLLQAKIPNCPTCCSLLATGYGIENANCKELLDIQENINSNYISLEKSIRDIEPLLTLLETGFYLVADAICYPTDGDKNFFWNVPNEEIETLATGPAAIYDDEDAYFNYIYGEPVYLYPTQTTDSYDKNRVEYYIDKFLELDDSSPRTIVYNFTDYINFIIDGHHKACASALLGEPLRCILIIPAIVTKYYNVLEEKNETYLDFSSIKVSKTDIPEKYLSFVKEKRFKSKQKDITIKDGNVNNREWEKEYLDSVKNYINLYNYAKIIDILRKEKINNDNNLMEEYLSNFDLVSQNKMKKIIYKLKLFDREKSEA